MSQVNFTSTFDAGPYCISAIDLALIEGSTA